MKKCRHMVIIGLSCSVFSIFISSCRGRSNTPPALTATSETEHLQNAVQKKASQILPSVVLSVFNDRLSNMKTDPSYQNFLTILDGLFDRFKQDQDMKSSKQQTNSGQKDLKDEIEKMSNTLSSMYGDIFNAGKQKFIYSGMGFGQVASVSASVSGDLGVGLVAEVSAHGGGGVERVYDFMHFQRAFFPFTICGVETVISIGEAAGISGSVGFEGSEDWIFGFKNDILEFSGPAIGGQVGLEAEGQLVAGLGLGVGVGYWESLQGSCASFNGAFCPFSSGVAGSIRGINYYAGVSGSSGPAEELSFGIKGGTLGTCSLGENDQPPIGLVSFLDLYQNSMIAGFAMAAEIIEPESPGISVTLTPFRFSAAAVAILYGILIENEDSDPATPLSASINVDHTTGVAPLWINFSTTVSGGDTSCDSTPYSYAWNFADGQTSDLSNPSHVFTAVGNYEVSLTVTDCAGTSVSANTVISVTPVNPSPAVTLSSISNSCASTTVVVGSTTQCTATGTYSDGSKQNITSSVSWASSSTSVGTISSSGVFTAVSAGTSNLSASKDGKASNSVPITVIASTGDITVTWP